MGQLSAFLNKGKLIIDPIEEKTKELVISERIKDESGKPIKWKIKATSQELNDRLNEKYKKTIESDGLIQEIVDNSKVQAETIVESVVYPDLKDSKLCESFGEIDPTKMIKKMLTTGEYLYLVKEVLAINSIGKKPQLDDQKEYEAAKKS